MYLQETAKTQEFMDIQEGEYARWEKES
jgi:hypothetical protein